MRRISLLLALILVVISTLSASADTVKFDYDGLSYEITSAANFTCCVTGYAGAERPEILVIPGTVPYKGKDLKVTEIYGILSSNNLKTIKIEENIVKINSYYNKSTFSGSENLTSVELPNTIKYIGDFCFENCISLSSISIPNSVTDIGIYCFKGCTGLIDIKLSEGLESLSSGLFEDCISLKTLSIPNNVETIGERCFMGCSSLNSLVLTNSIKKIYAWAFYGCKNLSLELPEGVETLGPYAFEGCASIEVIVIPSSVTSIERQCFADCSSLKKVTVLGSPEFDEDWLANCVLDEIRFESTINNYNIGNVRRLIIADPASQNENYNKRITGIQSVEYLYIGQYFTSNSKYNYEYKYSYNLLDLPNLKELTIGKFIEKGCVFVNNSKYYYLDTSCNFPKLEKIACMSTTPPSSCSFTDELYVNCELFVPEESLELYKSTYPWKNFWNINSFDPAGVEDIENDEIEKQEIGRYDLYGREVSENHKGLTIVKYSDGTTKKIVE